MWIPLLLAACVASQDPAPRTGAWRGALETLGGDLEFGLELARNGDDWSAVLVNADERIAVEDVTWKDGELRIEFPHYDSRVVARLGHEQALAGKWTKRSGPERVTELPFRAVTIGGPGGQNPAGPPGTVRRELEASRWAMHFASEREAAVLTFSRESAALRATVLTTTGDYRYLTVLDDARNARGQPVTLSCFDGAHAFLFRARWTGERTLEGDFWSGATWHDTWTATLDPDARLPDPFGLTRVDATAKLADLRFRGLDGGVRSLDEGELKDAPRLVQLFGTWCPNCNDEAPYLAELDRRFRDRGLRVAGIAFELTGEFARDAEQVKRYRERWKLEYPLFVGGLSDKAEASKAFPLLDKVRAYPTTLFVRRDGSVLAVHQGYSGPATGPAHDKLRLDFERWIERLLSEERK
ncbi:MAG: TlpA family protein disulfide reductase [Planctomycetes bacterium]|nr:TlpA family protein disulfide reductase [Planctomycetota bacterium]